jgi:GH35 family endo-1,4-beta-xylanase
MGELVITAKPRAEVNVEQLQHEFWFGTAITNSMVKSSYRRRMTEADLQKYKEVLSANFNSAVHENALKWHNCERSANSGFDYSVAEEIYRWCASEDIPMRGHCIFWATDRHVQGWVKQLDKDTLRRVVQRRAHDVTSRFKGRIDEFDLNNELIFGNFYRRKLGDGIIKEIAEWAKQGNEHAVLYLNEQGSLASGGRNADKYVALIRKTLDQGVPIGGIGCQGHFRQMFEPGRVQETLDRLGRFNLPIKITEYDYDNPDEQLRARHLRQFYEICFAHPAVGGILMWGFWEGAHWRPRAALWRRDWSETPAAVAYRDLVFKKWWTRARGKADSDGLYRVRAFYGKYSVESEGSKQMVTLRKDKGLETVKLQR